MARQARTMSNTGIYHVMIRGNEKRSIFSDDEDRRHFIKTVQEKAKLSATTIYAYCLMDNHVHFLLGEGKEPIAAFMKRINVSYAYYFNKKYSRIGHLFQDRFRSEVIEKDNSLLAAMRYIHNNPVKASMVRKTEDYEWSSYSAYLLGSNSIIDRRFLLNMFSDDLQRAVELLAEFHLEDDERRFMEYDSRSRDAKRQAEVETAIEVMYSILNNFSDDYQCDKDLRNEIILALRRERGLSVRQIAEVLNINRGVIYKAIKS